MSTRTRIDRAGGIVLVACGCFASAVAWADENEVEGQLATVAYYALPIVAALGGLGYTVSARPANANGRRTLLLVVSLAALAGWTLVLLTRTAIGGGPV